MDLHKKIQEFDNRWNISDDLTYEEKFKKFKTCIMNSFTEIDGFILKEGIRGFCNAFGIQEEWHSDVGSRYHKYSSNIINALHRENDPKKLYKLIEVIFALPFDSGTVYFQGHHVDITEKLYIELSDALKFSNIGVSIATRKDGDIILYPSGEEFLDKELVNGVLSFLKNKPEQHFVAALKSYEQNTPQSRVKSAESLRRALEEFLCLKLNNRRGLKANISELGTRLKGAQANNDLKNLVTQLLTTLDQFFNENSKHKDGNISEAENEFLIYQVALLMRYVHKII